MSTFTRNVHPYNERGEAGYLDPLGIYRRGQRAAGALRYARDVITAPVQTVIPHFPKYLVDKLKDPDYTQTLIQRKKFNTDYYPESRENYFRENHQQIMDQRHAFWAAGIMQENDVLEGINRQQRKVLAQHHLDEHTNGRLFIRDDLSYQPAEGGMGQMMMVVEDRATGVKTLIQPGSRVNASKQALGDWMGNVGELSRGFLPFGTDNIVDRTMRGLTKGEIAKKYKWIQEKGLFDVDSPNFVANQAGASKGGDTVGKILLEHKRNVSPEEYSRFLENFNENFMHNPMSGPSNIAERYKSGANFTTFRDQQDIATAAMAPFDVLDGIHAAVTGRELKNKTFTSPEEVSGSFIEQHMILPERLHQLGARIHEYGTKRLHYEVSHSVAMRKAIDDGKSFTEYARDNNLLDAGGNLNPRSAAWHVQTWEEASAAADERVSGFMRRTGGDWGDEQTVIDRYRRKRAAREVSSVERDMRRFVAERPGATLEQFVTSTLPSADAPHEFLRNNDTYLDAWKKMSNATPYAPPEGGIEMGAVRNREMQPMGGNPFDADSGGPRDTDILSAVDYDTGAESTGAPRRRYSSVDIETPNEMLLNNLYGFEGVSVQNVEVAAGTRQQQVLRRQQQALRRQELERQFPDTEFPTARKKLSAAGRRQALRRQELERQTLEEPQVRQGRGRRVRRGKIRFDADGGETRMPKPGDFENWYNETFANELAGKMPVVDPIAIEETNPLLANVHEEPNISSALSTAENKTFGVFSKNMYGDVLTLNTANEYKNLQNSLGLRNEQTTQFGLREEGARKAFHTLPISEQESYLAKITKTANDATTSANVARESGGYANAFAENIAKSAQPANLAVGAFAGILGKETADLFNFLSGHALGDKSKGDDMYWDNVLAGGLTAPYATTMGMFMSDKGQATRDFAAAFGSDASLAGFGSLATKLFSDAPAFAAGTAIGIKAGDFAESLFEKGFTNVGMNQPVANYFANVLGTGGVGGFVGGASTVALGDLGSAAFSTGASVYAGAGLSAALGEAVGATGLGTLAGAIGIAGAGALGAAIAAPVVAAVAGYSAIENVKAQGNLKMGGFADQVGRLDRQHRLQYEQRIVKLGLQGDITAFNDLMQSGGFQTLKSSRANILADYSGGTKTFNYDLGNQRSTQGGPSTLDGTHGHGWFAKQSAQDQEAALKDIFNQRMNEFEGLFNDQGNLDPGKYNQYGEYSPQDVRIWMQGNPEKYQHYVDFMNLKMMQNNPKAYDEYVEEIKKEGREVPTDDGLDAADRLSITKLGEHNLDRMKQARSIDHLHVDGHDIDDPSDAKNVHWISKGPFGTRDPNQSNSSEPEQNRTIYNPTDNPLQRATEKQETDISGAGGGGANAPGYKRQRDISGVSGTPQQTPTDARQWSG